MNDTLWTLLWERPDETWWVYLYIAATLPPLAGWYRDRVRNVARRALRELMDDVNRPVVPKKPEPPKKKIRARR